jgi:dihydroorotase
MNASQIQTLEIAQPDDWHLHLREGQALRDVVHASAAWAARALVMPNLSPPVTTVSRALAYRQEILAALGGATDFNPQMTLYLTDNTPVEEVVSAAQTENLLAFKLYPAGATTNSDRGVTDMARVDRALAMIYNAIGRFIDDQVDENTMMLLATYRQRVYGNAQDNHPTILMVELLAPAAIAMTFYLDAA